TQSAPSQAVSPAETGPATPAATSANRVTRAFARTSEMCAGSTLGMIAARDTLYAFDSTSTASAAGNSVSVSAGPIAAAIAQHSSPRANIVPAITYRRPDRNRSSTGPT